MEVRAIEHEAGNARAKGGVENGNNIVETMFESRLRFDPVQSVDELNAAAWAWCEAFNANRLPRQDTRLRRIGMTPTARYDLWLKIREHELRIPPDIQVCQALMQGKDEDRQVRRDLTITYRHPQADRTRSYVLAGLDGICARDTVRIRPLVFGDCAIVVEVPQLIGDPLTYHVCPETELDDFGQPISAPVIGERYAALPDTAIERAARKMDAAAFAGLDAEETRKARARGDTPFGGALDAVRHLHEIERVDFLPRRGTDIAIQQAKFEAAPLSHVEAAKALRAMGVDRADLYAWLQAQWPEGVPEDALPQIAAGDAPQPQLRALGT
jgi:hypothetical protein